MPLSDTLLAQAKRHAQATGRTLDELVRDAVIALIQRERAAASPGRLHLPVFHGDGLHEGVDIDDSAGLLDVMLGGELGDPGVVRD